MLLPPNLPPDPTKRLARSKKQEREPQQNTGEQYFIRDDHVLQVDDGDRQQDGHEHPPRRGSPGQTGR
jgi:hypothetical protein